jgi:hypothetical protein
VDGEDHAEAARPVLRFNVAPGVMVNPDGSREDMGEILHLTTR